MALVASGFCPRVFAEEAMFAFTYTTDLLPKGAKEIEQYTTWRFTKIAGTFDEIEGNTEIEYGLTNRLQVSGYINWAWTHAFHNGPFGQTTPPGQFADATPGPNDHYQSARIESFSAEAIYRVLSPYTDPIGLALYLEPARGPFVAELEAKLILQKNFFDDRLTMAFNYTYEPELRYLQNDDGIGRSWHEETDVNYNFGVSYRFAPDWSAGGEFLNELEYGSYNFTRESNNAFYLGPTIHYGGKSFFVTATFVKQLPWAKPHVDSVPGSVVDGYVFDNDFEKYRLRVKFGYYF
jgi:hypothetical protein